MKYYIEIFILNVYYIAIIAFISNPWGILRKQEVDNDTFLLYYSSTKKGSNAFFYILLL
jgi:hypothetical protein